LVDEVFELDTRALSLELSMVFSLLGYGMLDVFPNQFPCRRHVEKLLTRETFNARLKKFESLSGDEIHR
jgi:hypothetical protein